MPAKPATTEDPTPATPPVTDPPPAEPRQKKIADMTEEELETQRQQFVSIAFPTKPRQQDPEPVEPPDPAPAPVEGLSAQDKKLLEIYARMGKENPRYSSLPDDYIGYLRKEAAYIGAWLNSNAGQNYDPKAEEHQEFYRRNEPVYDEFEFESARETMITERATHAAETKVTARLEKADRERRIKDSDRAVAFESYMSVVSLVQKADPEVLGAMVSEQNGVRVITKEARDKMIETDPIAHDLVAEIADPLSKMIGELEKYRLMPEDYDPDPAKHFVDLQDGTSFPVTRELNKFTARYEQALLKLPPKDTMKDGKRLVSNVALQEAVESIHANKDMTKEAKNRYLREIESKYWTLGIDDFKIGLIEEKAQMAKAKIEKYRKHAPLKATPKPATPSTAQSTPENGQPVKPPANQPSRRYPSTPTTSDSTDTSVPATPGAKTQGEQIIAKQFGRVA